MTTNTAQLSRKPLRGPLGRLQNIVGSQFVTALTILAYLFLFTPLVILIIYSFNASHSTAVWSGFSVNWYRVLFKDRYVFNALRNSLMVASSAALISTVLGTFAAIVLVRRKFKGKSLFSTLMLSPLVLPEIVLGVAFLVFIVFLNIRLGFFSLIIAHIILTLPYSTLIVRASAAGLDRALEEAAADLGADEIRVFRFITLPLLFPGITAAFLLTFTISLDDYVMSMFAAGVGTTTLPLQIFSMLKVGITPEINALGTILILFNLILVLLIGGQHLGRVMGSTSA
jgi:ABC-type spermidine/putrescine transport system permease subunit II